MFQENSIETCILSREKQMVTVFSPAHCVFSLPVASVHRQAAAITRCNKSGAELMAGVTNYSSFHTGAWTKNIQVMLQSIRVEKLPQSAKRNQRRLSQNLAK